MSPKWSKTVTRPDGLESGDCGGSGKLVIEKSSDLSRARTVFTIPQEKPYGPFDRKPTVVSTTSRAIPPDNCANSDSVSRFGKNTRTVGDFIFKKLQKIKINII